MSLKEDDRADEPVEKSATKVIRAISTRGFVFVVATALALLSRQYFSKWSQFYLAVLAILPAIIILSAAHIKNRRLKAGKQENTLKK